MVREERLVFVRPWWEKELDRDGRRALLRLPLDELRQAAAAGARRRRSHRMPQRLESAPPSRGRERGGPRGAP